MIRILFLLCMGLSATNAFVVPRMFNVASTPMKATAPTKKSSSASKSVVTFALAGLMWVGIASAEHTIQSVEAPIAVEELEELAKMMAGLATKDDVQAIQNMQGLVVLFTLFLAIFFSDGEVVFTNKAVKEKLEVASSRFHALFFATLYQHGYCSTFVLHVLILRLSAWRRE
jgi:hypothetical protein